MGHGVRYDPAQRLHRPRHRHDQLRGCSDVLIMTMIGTVLVGVFLLPMAAVIGRRSRGT